MNKYLTGADLRKMFIGAYQAFARECDYINNLNVFPPALTKISGLKEINLNSNQISSVSDVDQIKSLEFLLITLSKK